MLPHDPRYLMFSFRLCTKNRMMQRMLEVTHLIILKSLIIECELKEHSALNQVYLQDANFIFKFTWWWDVAFVQLQGETWSWVSGSSARWDWQAHPSAFAAPSLCYWVCFTMSSAQQCNTVWLLILLCIVTENKTLNYRSISTWLCWENPQVDEYDYSTILDTLCVFSIQLYTLDKLFIITDILFIMALVNLGISWAQTDDLAH